MTDREKFDYYISKYVKRDGIQYLVKWCVDNKYFIQPASAKYHDCFESGLLHHSLNHLAYYSEAVARYYGCVVIQDTDGYLNFLNTLLPDRKIAESVVIISLFHDVCKCDLYTLGTKNVQLGGKWEKVPSYFYNENSFKMGHGVKSLYLVYKYINLTDEEAQAIRYHMGGYGEYQGVQDPDVPSVFATNKLAYLAHIADMHATYLGDRDSVTNEIL